MSLQISPIFNRSLLSRLLFSFVILFGLAACGGGGGGGGSSSLSVTPASITESDSGSANLSFTVTLSAASGSNVTLAYTTADDSAVMGEDYTFTSGTLTIPANSTSASIDVPVLGDMDVELDETFNLTISSAQGASIANGSMTVAGTIVTDDTLAGYYDNGTISVNGTGGSLTGVQAIVDTDVLAIADLTNSLGYILPVSNLDNSGFSGTARVYQNGNFVRTTAVTGTFSVGSNIDLILTGSGDYTTGTISITYNSTINTRTPPVLSDGDIWENNSGGFQANANENINLIISNNNVPSTALRACRADNVSLENIDTEQPGRARQFTATTYFCTTQEVTGFFNWFDDAGTDDAMLFILYNDDGIHAAQLSETP
mgnify:CR=1 FL=1